MRNPQKHRCTFFFGGGVVFGAHFMAEETVCLFQQLPEAGVLCAWVGDPLSCPSWHLAWVEHL